MCSSDLIAGWVGQGFVVALVARAALDAMGASRLRHECRQLSSDCLVSARGDSVIIVLGAAEEAGSSSGAPERALGRAAQTIASMIDGVVVIGPVVPGIGQAGRALRSALAGLRARPGWPDAPNPVHADVIEIGRASCRERV